MWTYAHLTFELLFHVPESVNGVSFQETLQNIVAMMQSSGPVWSKTAGLTLNGCNLPCWFWGIMKILPQIRLLSMQREWTLAIETSSAYYIDTNVFFNSIDNLLRDHKLVEPDSRAALSWTKSSVLRKSKPSQANTRGLPYHKLRIIYALVINGAC